MKKVCGFALIFFSLGMMCAMMIQGFGIKFLLLLLCMGAGVALFHFC